MCIIQTEAIWTYLEYIKTAWKMDNIKDYDDEGKWNWWLNW